MRHTQGVSASNHQYTHLRAGMQSGRPLPRRFSMTALRVPSAKKEKNMGRRAKARTMAKSQRLERIQQKFVELFDVLAARGFDVGGKKRPPIRLLTGTEAD